MPSNQNHFRFAVSVLGLSVAVTLAAITGSPAESFAQTRPATRPAQNGAADLITSGLSDVNRLEISPGKTQLLEMAQPVTEVSVGQPDIADVSVLSPTRLLVSGKSTGQTQLIIFADDRSQLVDVTVKADLAALQAQIRAMFPTADISVTESNGRIILRGIAPNVEASEQIALLAGTYGEVLNFLELLGGDQVMLQVVFAEVSRTASSSLGFNFGVTDGTNFGGSNVGGVSPLGIEEGDFGLELGVPSPAAGVTLFGVGTAGDYAFAGFLQALQDNNLLRVLARPNLVAISGEPASFLAGGEFPIPVVQSGSGDGAVTIEFREFGVQLNFTAVTLGDGRIRLECSPEVSELDFSIAVTTGGFVVPGLTQRRVDTTVELADGQSLAIAGLLSHNVAANKSAVPYLGEIPVLGALFRSVRYQRRETELVVFVTPRLVSGMDPAQVPAASGESWDHPSREELFLLGNLGKPKPGHGEGVNPPLFYGPYGFNRAAGEGGE